MGICMNYDYERFLFFEERFSSFDFKVELRLVWILDSNVLALTARRCFGAFCSLFSW